MASKKKKITLSRLLAEDGWELAYSSNKYQYYLYHPAPGVWGEIRKIKRSIVINYLDNKKG